MMARISNSNGTLEVEAESGDALDVLLSKLMPFALGIDLHGKKLLGPFEAQALSSEMLVTDKKPSSAS